MADTPENGAAAAAAPQEAPQIKSRILAQYIRDLSFENILAQKGVSGEANPEIQVQVNLDARKRKPENQYEVIMTHGVRLMRYLISLKIDGVYLH